MIVHEISRHVQNVLGTTQRFEGSMSRMEEPERNQLKARLELQADCYTGVWTYFVQKRNFLDAGDLDEVPAAQAVGDALNGAAAQRMLWFKQGLATGDPSQCDTFALTLPGR